MIKIGDIAAFFRSLLSYFIGFLVIIIFLPLLLILVSLPESWRYENAFLFRVADILYKGIVWAMLMPVKVEGRENLPDEPAIIIANHQSSLDIPIVGSVLDAHPHIWFALIDFINTPVLGYLIKKLGVWVDRRTAVAGARAVMQGIRLAKKHKAHIVLFPEGGRFADAKVHDFLKGFAVLARKAQRKVIPIYLPNNWLIYPPGSFILGYNEIKIIIGPSFTFDSDESEESFVARVHDWYDQKAKEAQ